MGWPISPNLPAISSKTNKSIESPILTVSAFTVLSPPVLSLDKKNNAENKLPTMTIKVKTTMTLINMILPNLNLNTHYESHSKQIQS